MSLKIFVTFSKNEMNIGKFFNQNFRGKMASFENFYKVFKISGIPIRDEFNLFFSELDNLKSEPENFLPIKSRYRYRKYVIEN